MLLHHLLTVSLIQFSYLCNFAKIGSLVLFLHDWADIPTSAVKITTELESKYFFKYSLVFSLLMWLSWFYSRIVVFPWLVYEAQYAIPPMLFSSTNSLEVD